MHTTVAPVVDEPPELLAANIRTGARLWAASLAFFFLAFFFAFLYLRALNTNGLWRGWPHTHKPHPSLAFGIVILICVVAGALVARAATLLPARTWRLAAAAAGALELAAVGLQCAQFSSLGFGPTDGAYASVFVGWTGLFALMLFGTVYWLATVISDTSRAVATPAFQTAAVEAVSLVLIVMAGIEVASFILLYVVA
jgi:heme/copper-type cytochrome/quinol oxidase subunit 3